MGAGVQAGVSFTGDDEDAAAMASAGASCSDECYSVSRTTTFLPKPLQNLYAT